MKKYLIGFILCCISSFVFAVPSLNFTPPPGDYSVVFLSNIFGIVDGVLHGTGSQMLGQLFAVFNSAVIALGGIMIMYTLIVSTMNTAHEGQFLGQKWSSIWVPVRSVTGIALLMPKASGYCMIQIFVMWVCVQGVGAADKVWDAALSYLNRGGAMVAQQADAKALMGVASGLQKQDKTKAGLIRGAAAILEGQVCMLAVQRALEEVRASALKPGSTVCVNPTNTLIQDLCKNPVPDLLASVNFVAFKEKHDSGSSYRLLMPNTEVSPYLALQGLCGYIHWNSLDVFHNSASQQLEMEKRSAIQSALAHHDLQAVANIMKESETESETDKAGKMKQAEQTVQNSLGLTQDERNTLSMTREIALQQMYEDLSTVAQTMINNMPAFTKDSTGRTAAIQDFAWVQFGEPIDHYGSPSCTVTDTAPSSKGIGSRFIENQDKYQSDVFSQIKGFSETAAPGAIKDYVNENLVGGPGAGRASTNASRDNDEIGSLNRCNVWGADSSIKSPGVLFSGTELYGALADYTAIMKPSLSLINQAQDMERATGLRTFIDKAKQSGWIMAGSYFYKLSRLNQASIDAGVAPEPDSGLGSSVFASAVFTSMLSEQASQCPQSDTACKCGLGFATTNAASLVDFCVLVNGVTTYKDNLDKVLSGKGIAGTVIPPSSVIDKKPTELKEATGVVASTVGGFLTNSIIFSEAIAPQPGNAQLNFIFQVREPDIPAKYRFPHKGWDGCCWICIHGCVQSVLSWVIYDVILGEIVDWIIDLVKQMVLELITVFITIPLESTAGLFYSGVKLLQVPDMNPIIALANMGVCFINAAFASWMDSMLLAMVMSINVILMGFLAIFMAFVAPISGVWLAIMASTGYALAYYVPFIPYMVFTFGSLAWMMAIIEAMVAAPIVALGVSSPEGDQAFGKGEQALMLLLNVFLRPSMMIIGYISGIMLSFVAVKLISAGFQELLDFVQYLPGGSEAQAMNSWVPESVRAKFGAGDKGVRNALNTGYVGWAGSMSIFFMMLLYTTMYLTVVQESFNLITTLPDKILRWIGGAQESIGAESARWGEQAKQKLEQAGADTAKGVKDGSDEMTKKGKEWLDKKKEVSGSITKGPESPKGP